MQLIADGHSQKCTYCRDRKKTGCEHNTVNTALGAQVVRLGEALRAAEDELNEHRAYLASLSDLAPTDKIINTILSFIFLVLYPANTTGTDSLRRHGGFERGSDPL